MNISPLSSNSHVNPQTTIPKDTQQVNINIPLPADLFIPDENGQKPIEGYDIKLVPKNAIITNKQEINELVDTAAKTACPDGMTPSISDTKAAKNIKTAKKAMSALINGAGQISLWNLAASSGAAMAGSVAIATGVAGTILSLDSLKDSFNLKGYYEGLKTKGITDVEVPIKQADGSETTVEIPIDKLISGAKKSVITNALKTTGNVLMATAGFAGGATAIVATAAIALHLGTAIYSNREAIAQLAQKAAEGIKNTAINIAHKITGHNKPKEIDSPKETKIN